MKKCSKCKKLKAKTSFNKNRNKKDGLQCICTNCRVIINRKYSKKINKTFREKHKDEIKNKRVEQRDKYGLGAATIYTFGFKLALEVYEKARRKCSVCDEVDDLTIHHRDGNGRHNKEKGLPMNNSIGNLQVLCRRCHGRIHGKQGGRPRK